MVQLREVTEFTVIVDVHAAVRPHRMHSDDRDAVGDHYEYSITAETEDEAAELALDEFHSEIPIKNLDHFDIEVSVYR